MADDSGSTTKAVGPYLLQRTLGKGQTGLVRLGVHCTTRKTVAVKIINREKLSKSVLMKVEREIAIMKLIDHPHVLGLYDVYESNAYLYLVLEHVSGGELFDYLVKKGRLSEREGRRFFRQIVSAVDFCHKHKVCHRDLKPENLLLDEHRNIKVADFGMASLQVGERLLETSCGSPHYACPEVIRGEHYDGRKADVWSCGVILYALLVGALPFDDDNLRVLLEKVKRGNFHIPSYVPPGAQQLLKGMVEVNPKKRLTLDNVMRHSWFRGSHEVEPVPPMQDAIETFPIDSKSQIDPDVFKSMSSLGCFKDKHALTSALLSLEPNEEKIVYFLLLSRKERQPSIEDEARAPGGSNQRDPPRKRIDSKSASSPQFQLQRSRAHSIGSANLDQLPPRSPRLSVATAPNYSPSAQGYYTYNAATPPTTRVRKTTTDSLTSPAGSNSTLDPASMMPPSVATPWKRKLSQTMKHLVVSPRFHRKRYDGSGLESPNTDTPIAASPQLAKRSWFSNFRSEKEMEEVVVVYRDNGFQDLKTSLLQALRVVNCHYEETSENSFKVKYESSKQKGKNVFKKPVKLTIAVVPTQTNQATLSQATPTVAPDIVGGDVIVFDGKTFTVTFSQISGPTRRFRRVCEKIQTATINPSSVNRMSVENVDFGNSNPSLSSDDTLATSTASPILGDASNSSREEIGDSTLLADGCVSTDDCESEDGGLNTRTLLGD